MARRIAGKDARSWAGRAAGDRRQQTWTGHAEQLLPNENGAKKKQKKKRRWERQWLQVGILNS
jgi:hypothetical protein